MDTAKDFAAIRIINFLLQKDEKCELRLINSLLHFTIQEPSINDPKPSTSSQIIKPSTSNNNPVKNIRRTNEFPPFSKVGATSKFLLKLTNVQRHFRKFGHLSTT